MHELGLLTLIIVHATSESMSTAVNVMDCTSTHVTIHSNDSTTEYHVRFDE